MTALRVLAIELDGGEPRARPDERTSGFGGSALAVELLLEHAREPPAQPAPLVIAVGDGVARGLPTTARATVASRGPLTRRLAEGAAGGELARRLVSRWDALVIGGRSSAGANVLVLRADGSVELLALPHLAGAAPHATHAALTAHFGACATLSIGPAGERGIPFASLASGGDPPHFVGRGGLGAVLGGLGLKALVVLGEPAPLQASSRLTSALLSSPRLEHRAAGGTLEQFGAFAARGDLRERNHAHATSAEHARELERELESARTSRHGCAGCPTPCGWSFRARGSGEQSARFGAAHALGLNLGLAHFDDALALYARCDELGLDAKETGAALALAARAHELGRAIDAPRFGERDAFLRAIDELVRGVGFGARLASGPANFAREVGLAHEHSAAKGATVRPDASLASLLGQCVSARGGDPMRTFPFLGVDGAPLATLRELTGLEWPEGAQDPLSPSGKGQLVWWHENLAAALDTSGFCAFSAAALLADRVLTLDELAREIAPPALVSSRTFDAQPGAAFVDLGERVVAAQRELEALWAPDDGGDRPAWASELLERSGALAEYLNLRSRAARPRRATPVVVAAERTSRCAARAGRVTVRTSGWLARELAPAVALELALPATWRDAADELASRLGTRGGVARDGRLLAAGYRDGRALDDNDPLADGDVLDLVLVVAGG